MVFIHSNLTFKVSLYFFPTDFFLYLTILADSFRKPQATYLFLYVISLRGFKSQLTFIFFMYGVAAFTSVAVILQNMIIAANNSIPCLRIFFIIIITPSLLDIVNVF